MRTIHAGHQRAHVLVQGALSSLERLTRPDGVALSDHVPLQVARALRSAADLLEGEVGVRPLAPLRLAVEMKHVEFSGTMSRAEADRVLEREAVEERDPAEGI